MKKFLTLIAIFASLVFTVSAKEGKWSNSDLRSLEKVQKLASKMNFELAVSSKPTDNYVLYIYKNDSGDFIYVESSANIKNLKATDFGKDGEWLGYFALAKIGDKQDSYYYTATLKKSESLSFKTTMKAELKEDSSYLLADKWQDGSIVYYWSAPYALAYGLHRDRLVWLNKVSGNYPEFFSVIDRKKYELITEIDDSITATTDEYTPSPAIDDIEAKKKLDVHKKLMKDMKM